MAARIRNKGLESVSLPYPFQGVLAPGEGTVVDATAAEVLTALGPIAGDSTLKVSDVTSATVDAVRLGMLKSGGYQGPGVPMQNRLRLLGAPGKAVQGNTVVIGSDTYEFRDSTPPAGGTAGRIWVYNGADSAASRANLINAINGVVNAATITRTGVSNIETVLASAGITTGDIVIQSADAVGGSVVPSASAIATTETLATATDIWDAATTTLGKVQANSLTAAVTITLNAAMIAKGTMEAFFPFTPTSCLLVNRSRPQNEAYTITGDAVSLTLAGGASPNNQAADVIDIIAFG